MSMLWLGPVGSKEAKCSSCYNHDWEMKLKRDDRLYKTVGWILVIVNVLALLKIILK